MQQHQKEMNEIEDIMFAMEQQFEESESEARQEFHSLQDEIKNKVKKGFFLSIFFHQHFELVYHKFLYFIFI